MSKKDLTIFVCDQCGAEIETEMSSGYPYKRGWCYIYHFCFKAPSLNTDPHQHVRREEIMDKHFCSVSCMENFLYDFISSGRWKVKA